jgi:hypothetical protein
MLRHLDVGSSYPHVVEDMKGVAVLHIIRNVSWVHTAVKQVGLYLPKDVKDSYNYLSTRGLDHLDQWFSYAFYANAIATSIVLISEYI